jgi:hypothetical protein
MLALEVHAALSQGVDGGVDFVDLEVQDRQARRCCKDPLNLVWLPASV